MEGNVREHGSGPGLPAQVTRRGFIRWALGFSAIATLGGAIVPVVGYLWPPARRAAASVSRVLVGALNDLPVGQAQILPVNDIPVIVVNTAQGGVKAFSAICTHLGCVVEWKSSRGIPCAHATTVVSTRQPARSFRDHHPLRCRTSALQSKMIRSMWEARNAKDDGPAAPRLGECPD